MANRPVFIPVYEGNTYVQTTGVEFEWYPGLAVSQKQKSIHSLHEQAKEQLNLSPVLEVSSKSLDEVGTQLSAFNLSFHTVKPVINMSVECAFQGSKVFEKGGPYTDLFHVSSLEAKKDPRLKNSGQILGFQFFGMQWELEPITAFYDWLYLNALRKNPELYQQLERFEAFTDIEFNPKRSVSCQAYTVALFKSLKHRGELNEALKSKEHFLAKIKQMTISNSQEDQTVQSTLF